jgi:RNA polymerase sigma factor (sigma-70 family)
MTNAPLGVVLRHIRTMVAVENLAAETDGQLLHRFTSSRDESAFASLLRRHGPMVLAVCRRVLPRVQDAEDVFQATFLLLARKAGSIRKSESVGSWLHGVAYRLSLAAKAQAACRQAHERRAATMHKIENQSEATWQELKAVLDEALEGLPEKYRTALVLSYLEGKSHEEAADQLGCPLATFRNWVARGRKLLRDRFARRGLIVSAGALAAALSENAAPAAVPAALLQPTLQSALQFATGVKAPAMVSSSVVALVQGGLKAMLVARLKLQLLLVLMVTILVSATGLGARFGFYANATDAEQGTQARTADQPLAEKTPGERKDANGDALPEGAIKRLGTLRFRLGGGTVIDLFLGPEGKTLISNTFNGARQVQVWEPTTGKLIRSFPGNYEYEPIAVSPDGNTLAIPNGAKIGLWDLSSGKRIRQLEAEKVTEIYALAFSADGKWLASSDKSGTIHFWYPASGEHAAEHATGTMSPISLLAYSPNGKILVSGGENSAKLQLWDTASRRLLSELSRPGSLNSIAFLPMAPCSLRPPRIAPSHFGMCVPEGWSGSCAFCHARWTPSPSRPMARSWLPTS